MVPLFVPSNGTGLTCTGVLIGARNWLNQTLSDKTCCHMRPWNTSPSSSELPSSSMESANLLLQLTSILYDGLETRPNEVHDFKEYPPQPRMEHLLRGTFSLLLDYAFLLHLLLLNFRIGQHTRPCFVCFFVWYSFFNWFVFLLGLFFAFCTHHDGRAACSRHIVVLRFSFFPYLHL